MDILTFFTPAEINGLDSSADVVVIFDVLRGTTTITAALKAGSARIFPIAQINEAPKILQKIGRENTVLGGSQSGEKIDSFHFGGSPLEYALDKIEGKNLIYHSVNIANAINASRNANRVLLGCFNNMQAVIESVGHPGLIYLLCAGKMGRFSFEDAVCAGMFIQRILDGYAGEIGLNDASVTSKYLYYRHHRDLTGMLAESSQGRFLKKIAHEADLEYSARVDSTNILPELSLDKTHLIPTVAFEEAL
jgi:2-phosphosulfolactate phosphatase